MRTLWRLVAVVALAIVAGAIPAAASASWNAAGGGDGFSKADQIPIGNTPTVAVSNQSVAVSWSGIGGSVPVADYVVKRYSAGGAPQAIGASCSGTVTGTSCTESGVPAGDWKYTVTPSRQNWKGAESTKSATATVNAPALTLSPSDVTSLPQALTGQITNFAPGQTVTFRLDNQATGQVLSGSIIPGVVPANGTTAVSVTLPSGVSPGPHTIHAIGSGSDSASAGVTVANQTTFTTAAFDLRDQSNGTTVVNSSEPFSFANDSRTAATTNWATTFSASRYIDVRYNSPLRSGSAVSSASFDFRFANTNGGGTVGCFYIQVLKASDDTVLSTHGSSAAPFGCVTGTTQQSFSVPISSSITGGAIANDLKIRIFGRSSGSGTWTIDRSTTSVTGSDGTATLYPRERTDLAGGVSPVATTWSLFATDSSYFDPATAWTNGYAAGRYLSVSFPAYVPAGATVNSVVFTHSYRSATAGAQVCNYIEIYSGATLISSHGSAASNLSCASSSTVNQTDTISLPGVDTVAEANSLTARIYLRRAATNTRSRHDLAQLTVSYTR